MGVGMCVHVRVCVYVCVRMGVACTFVYAGA